MNQTSIDKDALKSRIEKVLSEILSDKHECIVNLRFEKRSIENEKK